MADDAEPSEDANAAQNRRPLPTLGKFKLFHRTLLISVIVINFFSIHQQLQKVKAREELLVTKNDMIQHSLKSKDRLLRSLKEKFVGLNEITI